MKMASKPRASTTDAMDRKRSCDAERAMDTSEDSPEVREKRRRVDDHHVAYVVDKEIVEGNAERRDQRMRGASL